MKVTAPISLALVATILAACISSEQETAVKNPLFDLQTEIDKAIASGNSTLTLPPGCHRVKGTIIVRDVERFSIDGKSFGMIAEAYETARKDPTTVKIIVTTGSASS